MNKKADYFFRNIEDLGRIKYIEEVINYLYSKKYNSHRLRYAYPSFYRDENKHNNDPDVQKFLGEKEISFESFDRDMREEVKNMVLERSNFLDGFKAETLKKYINRKYDVDFDSKKLTRSLKRIGIDYDGKKWRIK